MNHRDPAPSVRRTAWMDFIERGNPGYLRTRELGHSYNDWLAPGADDTRYMIDRGATTIWERWDGWSAERGFQSAWMNSFNYYSLGSATGDFPGLPGASEAVFHVGPGRHEFSGPDVQPIG